jgi:hypothetical protein
MIFYVFLSFLNFNFYFNICPISVHDRCVRAAVILVSHVLYSRRHNVCVDRLLEFMRQRKD